MIGLTIVTYQRPEYAEKAVKSVVRHLSDSVDRVVLVNDGSDPKHAGAYKRVYKALCVRSGFTPIVDALPVNGGVAKAKNAGIRHLLTVGCDWIITMEDDLRVISPDAVTGYVNACEKSGLHHLSYAHHGPANVGGPVPNMALNLSAAVEYYPHAVGAWCIYSRECLEAVGLMDENFCCAWEHVEHSLRLAIAGYTTGPYAWADARNSRDWLAEQPGSIENSAIRPRRDWHANIINGLRYWRDEKPDSYKLMFGDGTPLQQYAEGLLA